MKQTVKMHESDIVRAVFWFDTTTSQHFTQPIFEIELRKDNEWVTVEGYSLFFDASEADIKQHVENRLLEWHETMKKLHQIIRLREREGHCRT